MTTQTSRLVIEIDSRNAERNTRAVANELENLTTKGYKADAQMTEMSSSIKTLVGFMGGLLTINKAIAMADGYTQMAARIRNATSSAEEYDLVQNRVLATANTTYRSLSEAQEVYLSLSGGMKSLGKSTTQTLDLVDSLSFSFTHNATRTDQAQSAMDALSKSMAKGKVDGDAWISIVTGADNIIADMAKTTGKTEAEIRKLGAEGKASLEDLIKTLIATREQNEKLANNMENSLADGFTTLSNAVTVYLGKANESTSATGIMAGALGELAQNLESVANVAMLGGVAYLTKTILAQTVAIRGSISASIAKRASLEAEAVAQAQLLALDVQRSRQAVAQTLTELNLARAELNSATTREARALATMRMTQAEVAYNIAMKQSVALVTAQTVAETGLATARTASARALALVGGPIGAITIGVTALTAGYMYFSSRTAEANAKLEEQAKVAQKTTQELLSLEGAQRASAKQDLVEVFKSQNEELGRLNTVIGNTIAKIHSKNTADAETAKILREVRAGTMSYDEAFVKLNRTQSSSPEIIAKLRQEIDQYEAQRIKVQQNADAQKVLGVQVRIAGNASQNAVGQHNQQAGALGGVESAARGATNALSEYAQQANEAGRKAQITNKLMAKGYSQGVASDLADIAAKNGTVTQSEAKAILYKNQQIDALNSTLERQRKAEQEKAKAISAGAKAQKSALAQQKKEAKDLERDMRQALEDAKSLIYEYTSEFTRIETDLKNEIEKINNSSLKSDSKTRMIADATAISEARKKLYVTELDFELNEYKMSETAKLSAQTNIKKLRIDSTKGLLADERKLKKDSADMESAHELGLIKLAKEQRIFQAEQAFMHEIGIIQESGRIEREQIHLTTRDAIEANRMIEASIKKQKKAVDDALKSAADAWMSIQSRFSGMGEAGSINFEFTGYNKVADEYKDASLAAAQEDAARIREEIWRDEEVKRLISVEEANQRRIELEENLFTRIQQIEAEHYQNKLELEKQYYLARTELGLSTGQAIATNWADIFKQMYGEQSSAYAAMFAMEKSFAVARALMNAPMVYTETLAALSGIPFIGPYIAKPMAIAASAATVAQAGMIGNITPKGYATGGLIRGPGTSTSDSIPIMASDTEFMMRSAAVKSIGVDNLNYMNKYGELPENTYRVGMGTVDAINRGADVQAERQAQANVKAGAGQINSNPQHLQINNILDPAIVGDFMSTPAGTKVFMNFIKNNRSSVKAIVG